MPISLRYIPMESLIAGRSNAPAGRNNPSATGRPRTIRDPIYDPLRDGEGPVSSMGDSAPRATTTTSSSSTVCARSSARSSPSTGPTSPSGRGEFFSLLGPSGCGKTTLLKMIAGFERPTSGRVMLEGVDVSDVPPHKRNVNTVFQQYALFPHMSVFDNVAFGLRAKKVASAEVRRRAMEMLDVVRLAEFAGRRPAQLSGGQQQRVALARALVNLPSALLLDEPLAALDLKLREAMQIELKRIQREVGITFIFVTHDQGEALTMSDRMAVMSRGLVEQIGTPEEIYAAPASIFVAGFIGSANLLPGTLDVSANGGRPGPPGQRPARRRGPADRGRRRRPGDGDAAPRTPRRRPRRRGRRAQRDRRGQARDLPGLRAAVDRRPHRRHRGRGQRRHRRRGDCPAPWRADRPALGAGCAVPPARSLGRGRVRRRRTSTRSRRPSTAPSWPRPAPDRCRPRRPIAASDGGRSSSGAPSPARRSWSAACSPSPATAAVTRPVMVAATAPGSALATPTCASSTGRHTSTPARTERWAPSIGSPRPPASPPPTTRTSTTTTRSTTGCSRRCSAPAGSSTTTSSARRTGWRPG